MLSLHKMLIKMSITVSRIETPSVVVSFLKNCQDLSSLSLFSVFGINHIY